jgi:hypothetical protein
MNSAKILGGRRSAFTTGSFFARVVRLSFCGDLSAHTCFDSKARFSILDWAPLAFGPYAISSTPCRSPVNFDAVANKCSFSGTNVSVRFLALEWET